MVPRDMPCLLYTSNKDRQIERRDGKKAGKLACIVLLVAGMMGCSKTTKQPEQEEGKELVWWIDKEHAQAPWFKHTNSLQDKQYLQNKYTEECNRLLKQHQFPYEVKFRYMNREDSAYALSLIHISI